MCFLYIYFFFFVKQNTAYDMRISDWSSDVCSSDLVLAAALSTSAAGLVVGGIFGSWLARGFGVFAAVLGAGWALYSARSHRPKIGRASCRERVCQYV